jgi:hypothetical protein
MVSKHLYPGAIALQWFGTRAYLLLVVLVTGWASVEAGGLSAYADLWNRWDSRWFESIATEGYVGTYVSDFEDFRYNVAFFPGFPALVRGGIALGLDPTIAGMIVSLVAGFAAALAIGRLVRQVGGDPRWGALAWVVAPTAVFLSAAYTEALFAAFAFWAWTLAKDGYWWRVAILGALAGFVRPNGMFLAAGLVVMVLVARPLRWQHLLAALTPLISALIYFYYLWTLTGNWNAWSQAQNEFWERELVDPITALINSYNLIFTFSPTGEPSSRFITEILAMGILVLVVVITAFKSWWGEFTYTLVTALSLGTSSMYHSVPRTLVVVFPLWMLIGLWLGKATWRRWAYVIVLIPILTLVTIRFTQNQWIS